MATIAKNTTGSSKTWGGIVIGANSQYTLQTIDIMRFLSDSIWQSDLQSGYCVINDGSDDLNAVNAVLWMQGYLPQFIKGSTDGTDIGNVGDRLKVDAQLGVSPTSNVMYISQALVNGSSRTMNVNGSVTPQNFLYTVPGGTIYYLESISIIISDTGTPTAAKFGDLAALTNGFRLQIKSSGTTYDFYNFKTNGELSMAFNEVFVPPGAGWLNDTDLLVGTLRFKVPIKLNGTNSDFVQFTVRDNLSGLNNLISNITMWRVI